MIKVLQFGEGNFLRTFVDHYFNTLNQEGGDYKVDIVKPITFGTLERFVKQNNKYHIVLRGVKKARLLKTFTLSTFLTTLFALLKIMKNILLLLKTKT